MKGIGGIVLVSVMFLGCGVISISSGLLFPTLLKTRETLISNHFPTIDLISESVVSRISKHYGNSSEISSFKIHTDSFQYGKTQLVTLDLQLKTPNDRFPENYQDVSIVMISPNNQMQKLWSFDSPSLSLLQHSSDFNVHNNDDDYDVIKPQKKQEINNKHLDLLVLTGPLELTFNTESVDYYLPKLLEFYGQAPNKKLILENGVTIQISGVSSLQLLETISPSSFTFSPVTSSSSSFLLSTPTIPHFLLSSSSSSSKISIIGDKTLKAKIGYFGTLILSNRTNTDPNSKSNSVSKFTNDNHHHHHHHLYEFKQDTVLEYDKNDIYAVGLWACN